MTKEAYEKLMKEKKWPELLQDEVRHEFFGEDADDLALQFVEKSLLIYDEPIELALHELLRSGKNTKYIERAPQDAIERINKHWDLDVSRDTEMYDRVPDRYFNYANMPAHTADPSVLVDDEIIMGVGRFIAALMRGDRTLSVWVLKEH